jgi:serine/threonine-protein kinase RsbW
MIISKELRFASDASLLQAVRKEIADPLTYLHVTEDDIDRAKTIGCEAATNAIKYAYSQPHRKYRVRLRYHADRLIITVADTGKGCDICMVPAPVPGQLGGYGLFLMRRMADSIRFRSCRGSGTVVMATVSLHYTSDDALEYAQQLDDLRPTIIHTADFDISTINALPGPQSLDC